VWVAPYRWCLLPLIVAAGCIDLSEPAGLELPPDGAAAKGDAGTAPIIDAPADRERGDAPALPPDGGPPLGDGPPGSPPEPPADDAMAGPTTDAGAPGTDGPPAIDGAAMIDASPTMDAAPPVDAAPMIDSGGAVVVDDFSDGDPTTNNLGGAITSDNETLTQVAGEQKLVWNGTGSVQDFNEGLRANGCELDISGFRTLRFRARSSTAGKRLAVLLGIGDGACNRSGVIRQSTITITTTMTSYDVDLTHTAREETLFVQFAPTAVDGVELVLDDIVLVP
jgi:hypothetical protein